MNEMNTDYRDYRDYRDDYRSYRDYRNGYREYDMRGGRPNYRNYRDDEYKAEVEKCMYEAKERHREFEDLAEMAKNPEERNLLMKIALREKEHYENLKQMVER